MNNVPTQKSRWDDVGVEPPAGEARYQAGEQPIAEYDNWFNKAVVDDIAAIITFLRNLGLTKIYQDVEENMPTSGSPTELFIATDTGKIYVGTGSGWRELTVDWNAILNKPSTFPPSPHQHDDADLLSIDWSKILNKPSTYPPSAHTHSKADIIDLADFMLKSTYDSDGDGIVEKADYAINADKLDGLHAADIIAQAGALKKIADIVVPSSNPVQIIDITGLDGNADKMYLLVIYGFWRATVDAYTYIQPNGDSTNFSPQAYHRSESTGNDTYEVAASPIGWVALRNAWATSGDFNMVMWIRAETGKYRSAIGIGTFVVMGGGNCHIARFGGVWKNMADNITRLRINFNGKNFDGRIMLFGVR